MAEKNETKKKSGVRTAVTLIVILVVLGLTAFAVVKILNSKNNAQVPGGMPGMHGGQGMGNRSETVTSVTTVIAQKETMHDFVSTNGDIETQSSIEVYPNIAGKIVQVNVSLGSHVNAGDIIAYVDPSAAGVNYKWSPVTAPISGSIIQTPAKTGQQVSTGTVVTKIGDIENLQVTASIPERYVGYLKTGLKAEITVEAYSDVVFTATVVRVSPVLDSASRTKSVILNFDKKDSRINAGMFAKVKLYTVDYPDAIAISQDAIVTQDNDNYLYVVKEDSTAEKRAVTLGKNVSGMYQILSGINEGDKVIVAGMLTLSDGSKVKDITAASETSDDSSK